jgi:(p)ppGpp synthase/HD superfamily hydrolase
VAEIVADMGLDLDSLIAALLHDCIEDTGTTYEEISKLYSVFLRKTSAYMARHPDIDPEKAAAMLVDDIAAASQKLRRMMEDCLDRIDSITGGP